MAILAGALHTTANKSVGPVAGGNFPSMAYQITIATSGTVEHIFWRQWYNNGASKAAVYSADKSTLLGETNSISTPTTGTRDGTVSVPFAVTAAQQLWVCILTNNDNDSVCIQTNNDGTDVVANLSFPTYAFASSFTSSFTGNNLGVPGITLEGTASGGASNAPRAFRQLRRAKQ